MRQLVVFFGLMGLWLIFAPAMHAQEPIQIIKQEINSRFREAITAQLNAEHNTEITNVEFFYRISGRGVTSRNVANFEPGISVEAEFRINQRAFYFPPGTEIEYWWKLTDANGNSLKTDPAAYLYLDNRYEFKTRTNERLTLYWYNGNRAFGEALFQQAVKALDRLETDVGVTITQPIKVFIYGNHDDLLNAISVGAREWTGGVAYTEHGVVIIGIAPDHLAWGLEAMTHELTHLVIHQATDNPYSDLPTWLNEGVAVYNESPDALPEEYAEAIEDAAAGNALFTLRTLSSSFPADPEDARLAYGQSAAVFHFMIDTYGSDAIAHLFEIFAEGSLPDKALQQALGEDTISLDNAFRASLGLPPLLNPNRQPQEQALPDQPTEDAAEPVVEAQAGTAPEPAQTPDITTPDHSSRRRFQCLSGLLPLTALGLIITQRRRQRFSS